MGWGEGEEKRDKRLGKRKDREEEGKERSSILSLVFPAIGQKGKFFLAVRASSRDRKLGVSTTSKR